MRLGVDRAGKDGQFFFVLSKVWCKLADLAEVIDQVSGKGGLARADLPPDDGDVGPVLPVLILIFRVVNSQITDYSIERVVEAISSHPGTLVKALI